MGRDQANHYPMFAAFAGRPMSREEAATATPEERIASVWPFLVGCVLEFQKTLRPRERCNFDPEDTLSELYIELHAKDDKYDPARGKYITFAAKIAYHALCEVRDQSRTVQAPRNSSHRLRGYEADREAGTLTDRRRQTADAIRRVHSDIGEVFDRDRVQGSDAPAIASHRERKDVVADVISEAVAKRLTTLEAIAIGRTKGLWGAEAWSVEEIAKALGRDPSEIRRARVRGNAKIRAYIYERGDTEALFE